MTAADGKSKSKAYALFESNLIDKTNYLQAIEASVVTLSPITNLLASALTDKINDRETFMKGIDYSYYYEQDRLIFTKFNNL